MERLASRPLLSDEEMAQIARDNWAAAEPVECPVCLLPDARRGFWHPTPDNQVCQSLGPLKPTPEMVATTDWDRVRPKQADGDS